MRGEQLERLPTESQDLDSSLSNGLSSKAVERVLNQTNLSPKQELTNDLLNILQVFSCRART